MKTIIKTTMILLLLTSCSRMNITRNMQGKIISTNKKETIIETVDGNIWTITDEVYDLGQNVIVEFDTMSTVEITDDTIITIK